MRTQRGLSAISILLIIVLAFGIVKTGLAVLPMYWDYQIIGTILDKMYDTTEFRTEKNPSRLRAVFEERLKQNNIDIPTTNLVVRHEGSGIVLDWQYEQRAPWLGNIDLIGTFQRTKEF